MKKYRVSIPEVHHVTLELEADSEDEAKQQANRAIEEGLLDAYDIEYSHTMDLDEWSVTEMK